MKITQLTDSKIKSFKKKIQETKDELNKIKGTAAARMWINDINEFEKIYEKTIN